MDIIISLILVSFILCSDMQHIIFTDQIEPGPVTKAQESSD